MSIIKKSKPTTAQIRQGLLKIKQTQLEVLKQLKKDQMLQESRMSINQNMRLNSYNSTSHINLLKVNELTQLKQKNLQEKERHSKEVAQLYEKIKRIEQQTQIKTKRIEVLEKSVTRYEQKLSITYKQIELTKIQYEESIKKLQEQYKNNQKSEKMQLLNKQNVELLERKYFSYENLINEIKIVSECHNKIYQSLKSRSRLTIDDLDVEQSAQQSLEKILHITEVGQKLVESGKNQQQSQINGRVIDSESFREDMRRIQKQMYSEKQIQDLKSQVSELREDKYRFADQMKQLETAMQTLNKDYRRMADDKSKIQEAAIELKKQIEVHRTKQAQFAQKEQVYLQRQRENLKKYQQYERKISEKSSNEASHLEAIDQLQNHLIEAKKEISGIQNLAMKVNLSKNNDEDLKNLRNHLGQVININQILRKQKEENLRKIDQLSVEIQRMKYERQQLDNTILQKHTIIEKQLKEKDRILKQLREFQEIISTKEQKIAQWKGKLGIKDKQSETKENKLQRTIEEKQRQIKELIIIRQKAYKDQVHFNELQYKYQMQSSEYKKLKNMVIYSNDTINHLWSVKEAQYGNIYDIFSGMKTAKM